MSVKDKYIKVITRDGEARVKEYWLADDEIKRVKGLMQDQASSCKLSDDNNRRTSGASDLLFDNSPVGYG